MAIEVDDELHQEKTVEHVRQRPPKPCMLLVIFGIGIDLSLNNRHDKVRGNYDSHQHLQVCTRVELLDMLLIWKCVWNYATCYVLAGRHVALCARAVVAAAIICCCWNSGSSKYALMLWLAR